MTERFAQQTERLTQHAIDTLALPTGKDDWTYWDRDVSGYGLRLRKGGSRTLVFWYRIGRQRRKMVIGSAEAVRAAEGRKRAEILYAEVKLGRDPAGAKAEGRTRAAETVGAVLRIYLARQKERLRPRAYVEVERHLNTHAERLHRRPLTDVTRRDVAGVLTTIAAGKSDATANRVRSSLSAFAAWCIREGLLDSNPVAWTERRPETSRSRLITPEELREIWASLRDDAYGNIVRLLVLCGARREEIGAVRWSEVNLEAALIELPPERVKNARARIIVLSQPAVAILQKRPRLARSDGHPYDLVFGHGARGFTDWAGSKIDLDARITARRGEPLPDWTLHDFRRLLSTTMHEQLAVPPHVVEACLGHVGHQRGTPGVYNRAAYVNPMREALARWAEFVLAVVEGRESNVVALRSA
jgi:integrase